MNTGQQENAGSSGPVIGVIVILVVIILAGLYFWGERGADNIQPVEDNIVESITTQSESDDAAAIENDLNNTDLEVDSEINAS